MNREQAKQLLPIIQAFADGADVQFENSGWQNVSDPTFYVGVKWRIKPEPLEGWGTIWHDGDLSTTTFHQREADAHERVCVSEGNRRMFRWVEVTE